LSQLVAPGSSLGGARPKSAVIDEQNRLCIAKFPSRRDAVDVGAWEMVVRFLSPPTAKVKKKTPGSDDIENAFSRVEARGRDRRRRSGQGRERSVVSSPALPLVESTQSHSKFGEV